MPPKINIPDIHLLPLESQEVHIIDTNTGKYAIADLLTGEWRRVNTQKGGYQEHIPKNATIIKALSLPSL